MWDTHQRIPHIEKPKPRIWANPPQKLRVKNIVLRKFWTLFWEASCSFLMILNRSQSAPLPPHTKNSMFVPFLGEASPDCTFWFCSVRQLRRDCMERRPATATATRVPQGSRVPRVVPHKFREIHKHEAQCIGAKTELGEQFSSSRTKLEMKSVYRLELYLHLQTKH